MYAQLCTKLGNAKDAATGEPLLPTFENPDSATKRIDLRRLLLNKCQVEFEKGIEADSKVKAREEQETKGGAEVRTACVLTVGGEVGEEAEETELCLPFC